MPSGEIVDSVPPGDHHVGVAALDRPERLADRVRAGRAGRHGDLRFGPFAAVADRDLPRPRG
jgi:hypothetical protein